MENDADKKTGNFDINSFVENLGGDPLKLQDFFTNASYVLRDPPSYDDFFSKEIEEIEPVVSNAGIAESLKENLVPIIERQNEMLKNDATKIGLLESQYFALDKTCKELEEANKKLAEELQIAKDETENNKKDIKAEGIKSTLSLIFTGLAFLVSVAALIVSIVK